MLGTGKGHGRRGLERTPGDAFSANDDFGLDQVTGVCWPVAWQDYPIEKQPGWGTQINKALCRGLEWALRGDGIVVSGEGTALLSCRLLGLITKHEST